MHFLEENGGGGVNDGKLWKLLCVSSQVTTWDPTWLVVLSRTLAEAYISASIAPLRETHSMPPLEPAMKRTLESYEELATTGDNVIDGVKFNSRFNRLNHFHVCQPGLPPALDMTSLRILWHPILSCTLIAW